MAKKTISKKNKKIKFDNNVNDNVPYIIIAILTVLVVVFAVCMFYGVGCRCYRTETTCSAAVEK
ncbi:MAG: hypothetical protein K6E99_04665 [Bacilli bacterium]|nr:hypothetical protein [Bacilli bacterium]